MPKRRRCGDLVTCSSASPPRQRDLYLVFDDWCWGCSIRKVDLDAATIFTNDWVTGGLIDKTMRSLPPAVFCFEAPRDFPTYFASAFGTKIIAIHPRIPDWHPVSLASGRGIHPVAPMKVSAYDVQSRAILLGPLPKAAPCHPIYISAGSDNLFALSGSSFERLSLKQRMKNSQFWVRPWKKLEDAPFKSEDVSSYTVHPDGQTLFFHVMGDNSFSTFTFNPNNDNGGSRWQERGDWSLPFTGRAHYDRDLNAWVGISGLPGPFGYICICPMVSTDSKASDGQYHSPQLLKEYLCSVEPSQRLISWSLHHTGPGSSFCLALVIRSKHNVDLQPICSDEANSDSSDAEDPPAYHFMLRLTTFHLEYDENRHVTMGCSILTQHYRVPDGATESALERPFAFPM